MRRISKIEDFNFDLKQRPRYCIPASIQAVSNYLRPDLPINQDEIFRKYQSHGGTLDNIGLEQIKREVLDKEPEFKWSESEYIAASSFPNFALLVARVRASVEGNLPHIVSTRIPVHVTQMFDPPRDELSPWHMLTVVGYDEQNFEVYNPEPISRLAGRSVVGIEQLKGWLLLAHPESEVTDSLVMRRRS